MGGVRAGRGSQDHTPCSHWQTHTVVAGLRLDGLTAPAVFDGPLDNADVPAPMSSRSWCRRFGRAMSSSSTISRSTNSPRSAPRLNAVGAHAPLPAALQSRLQSDRTSVCQAESVSARRAPTHLRPRVRADRGRARASSRPTECANYVRHCGYRVATSL